MISLSDHCQDHADCLLQRTGQNTMQNICKTVAFRNQDKHQVTWKTLNEGKQWDKFLDIVWSANVQYRKTEFLVSICLESESDQGQLKRFPWFDIDGLHFKSRL